MQFVTYDGLWKRTGLIAEDRTMTDRTPPYTHHVDRAVANAARVSDIKRRERLARPMSAGADMLKSEEGVGGLHKREGWTD